VSDRAAIHAIVVMGVSGAGKSTLGSALGDALGYRFVEGDALHPPANVAKMAAGIPLDDADRQSFLGNVAAALATHRDEGVVASCSALKRAYRDLLRRSAGPIVFVLPMLDRAALARRLSGRAGHFMPAALLDSQLATLEPPAADEDAIMVDGTLPIEAQVAAVLAALGQGPLGG
jgi:gluconokinase